jgi:hypothetical protein
MWIEEQRDRPTRPSSLKKTALRGSVFEGRFWSRAELASELAHRG